ncbi:PAS domain-containing protein, partial [Streptomyces sp. NPDC054808]
MEDSSATVIVDARGLVTGWSDGARRLTGYTAEEVVGGGRAGAAGGGGAPPPPPPPPPRARRGGQG